MDVGAEVGGEQLGELGGVVGYVDVAADEAGGAELFDDAAAVSLHRLAVEAEVGELQAVVGVGVDGSVARCELRFVPRDGAGVGVARTRWNGSAVNVSVARCAVGVAGELDAADARPRGQRPSLAPTRPRPGGDAFEVAAEGDVAADGRRAGLGEADRDAAAPGGDGAAGELQVVRFDRPRGRVPAEVAGGFDARLDEVGGADARAEVADAEVRLGDLDEARAEPQAGAERRLAGELLGDAGDPGAEAAGPAFERAVAVDADDQA